MKKYLITIFLWYIRTLASLQLKKINPKIIGIGGASGKSSLAHLTSQILGQKYEVKQSKGKNSETGIPLNILDIDIEDYSLKSWLKIAIIAPIKLLTNNQKYDYYVLEMGIDSPKPPKNMSYLLKFIKPNISVLTNVNIEHSQYFDEISKAENLIERKKDILEKIFEEEKLLITQIDENGRVIVNLDDEFINSTIPLSAKTISVSRFNKSSDFFIQKIDITEEYFKVKFNFLNESYEININTPLPKYFVYIFVFAIAIAFSSEINIKSSIEFIEKNFQLPAGRFTRFKGIKNSIIFDSTYNSSLEATVGALEVLSIIGSYKRKIGILGDMRELGSLSKIQHESLAKEIINNLDYAILIGPLMKEFVVPILDKNKFKYNSFENFKDSKETIINTVRRNDLILIKGSQNTLFLERAVELLLNDKKDRDLLCRRGKYWDKIRQKTN